MKFVVILLLVMMCTMGFPNLFLNIKGQDCLIDVNQISELLEER